jgi:phage shock protein PspC (stress-responsive transcriptional regulator)
MEKKLKKSSNKIIAGVCAGVAEYFEIDPTIVRIAWAASVIFAGLGFWLYIICMLVMPNK